MSRRANKPPQMTLREITYTQAIDFLLPRHYSGRKPQIRWAFGWYDDTDTLQAVCTFGKPASHHLCIGICGTDYAHHVFELNRLCRLDTCSAPLSQFVAGCLKALRQHDVIVVSYSDTAMNHHGYIYQATNFLYTGRTVERTDKWTPDNKHSRHYDKDAIQKYRKVRSSKHRYIFFATSNKRLRKEWQSHLNYPVLAYPKGDNSEDYELGFVLQPTIIPVS